MASLYLLRHGKSDWGRPLSDHDRPLRPRGVRAAQQVGELLTARDEVPELILSSSAVRARRTAELAIEAGGWDVRMHSDRGLYLCSVEDLLSVVAGAAPGYERVLVAGHEPTTSGVIEVLCGARCVVPTGALARIDLASWTELENGGELRWLLPPRVLAALR